MVTIDKLQRGLSRYLDNELLAHMSGKDKWILAGIAAMYLNKLPTIIKTLSEKPAVKVLGIIGEDGQIDAEYIINSIRPAARNTTATFEIPMAGTVTLAEQDLDTLLAYIVN